MFTATGIRSNKVIKKWLPITVTIDSFSVHTVITGLKILQEVRPKSQSSELRVRVLENFTLLATKSKQNVEEALKRLMEMASTEVSVILDFYHYTHMTTSPSLLAVQDI